MNYLNIYIQLFYFFYMVSDEYGRRLKDFQELGDKTPNRTQGKLFVCDIAEGGFVKSRDSFRSDFFEAQEGSLRFLQKLNVKFEEGAKNPYTHFAHFYNSDILGMMVERDAVETDELDGLDVIVTLKDFKSPSSWAFQFDEGSKMWIPRFSCDYSGNSIIVPRYE